LSLDPKLQSKLSRIKALVLDCDGILTDTRISYMGSDQWSRSFSIRDGFGILKLREAGILVSVITTSKSEDIRARMKVLKIEKWYEGVADKVPAWEEFLQQHGLQPEEVAYMGDDDPDLPLLRRAGFSATVSDAMESVLSEVDYVARRPAGCGAVREVCELILKTRG
jgi:3-deoxy-D-manno-octulosonate 8-phosphate phosphatase (KDO 8-P phosphatase)